MKRIGCLFALAGCAASPEYKAEQLDKAMSAKAPASIEAAQATVREFFAGTLKDPGSAQYRNWGLYNVSGYRGFNGWLVCGEVNAKNGFGGYSGYSGFYVQLSPWNPEAAADYYVDSAGYQSDYCEIARQYKTSRTLDDANN